MSLMDYLPANNGKVAGSYVLVEVPSEILNSKENLGQDTQTILGVVRNQWVRNGNPLVVVDYSSTDCTLVKAAGKGGAVLIRENAFPQMLHDGDVTKMLFRDSDVVFTWPKSAVDRASKAYEAEGEDNQELIDNAIEELDNNGHDFKEDHFKEEFEESEEESSDEEEESVNVTQEVAED